ncbi:VWA domain-containing protein [bacterium]|nr:VWA domain-containing protein [bacterium]
MFTDLFYLLRSRGVPVTPTEWLAFLEGIEKGLADGRPRELYLLGRALLVKREAHLDRYDLAFYDYLKGAQAPEDLKAQLLRALARQAFSSWLTPEDLERLDELTYTELLQLLEQRIGKGERPGAGEGALEGPARTGEGKKGGREDGEQGTRAAMADAERRRFRNLRSDVTLDVRQLTLALRRLRRLLRDGIPDELDLDGTIEKTCKNGGDIELAWRPERRNTIHLSLLCDVGGSMEPFRHLAERLFSAASKAGKFKRYRTYYFHNCIYGRLYRDIARRDGPRTEDMLRESANDERLIVVGDACMAPFELFQPAGGLEYWSPDEPPGIDTLGRVRKKLPRSVWLNPLPRHAWDHPTIAAIGGIFPMLELTLDGVDEAVTVLRKGLAYRR